MHDVGFTILIYYDKRSTNHKKKQIGIEFLVKEQRN
jgi:hypothetical protein